MFDRTIPEYIPNAQSKMPMTRRNFGDESPEMVLRISTRAKSRGDDLSCVVISRHIIVIQVDHCNRRGCTRRLESYREGLCNLRRSVTALGYRYDRQRVRRNRTVRALGARTSCGNRRI